MNDIFSTHRGDSPVLISMPHSGTRVPVEIADRFTEDGRSLADTDWHLPELYAFVRDTPVNLQIANYSRYVVDLNRDPQDVALYTGADNTSLCPTTTFSKHAIYRDGAAPCADEIQERVATYWAPYHEALQRRLDALVTRWGYAILFDAHSIRAQVPRFFTGRLPDLNVGTNSGASASETLAGALMRALQKHKDFVSVLNGRFKGGYITRQYGRPEQRVHAVQLEMVQDNYMNEEPPFELGSERVALLMPALKAWVDTLLSWTPQP